MLLACFIQRKKEAWYFNIYQKNAFGKLAVLKYIKRIFICIYAGKSFKYKSVLQRKGHQFVYRLLHWLSVGHIHHHKLKIFWARTLSTYGKWTYSKLTTLHKCIFKYISWFDKTCHSPSELLQWYSLQNAQ